MNKLAYNVAAELAEEKQKLLQWIKSDFETDETKNINADVTELSILTQLMGYKLESFQTLSHLQNTKDSTKLEITCYKSGIRSVLIKQSDTCSCPSKDALEKGQFWNVVGIEPSSHSSQTSISNSASSLLPNISNSIVTKMIKGVLERIVDLIKNLDDNMNNVAKTPEPLFIRHNSLDIAKRKEGLQRLKRTNSFDISFPRQTSTPDAGLSNLNVKNIECSKCDILTKNLISINNIIKESLEVEPMKEINKTFKNMSRKISDIKPGEGPSVRHLKDFNRIRSEVKREIPKFRSGINKCDTPTVTGKEYGYRPPFNSATRGTIPKVGTPAGVSKMIKAAKPLETPYTRVPKRKI